MTREILVIGVSLCVLGLVGIAVSVHNSPKRRALRRAARLYAHALRLDDGGERGEAQKAGQEALAGWLTVGDAAVAPGVRASLVASAAALATRLHDTGRDEEALPHLAAAEAALGERMDARPETFRPVLAEVLATTAAALGALGRFAEALRYDGMALLLYRRLDGDRPGPYAMGLIRCLAREAEHFREIGRTAEALAASREALQRLRARPAAELRCAHAEVARVLQIHATVLLATGRAEEARPVAEESAELYKRLSAARPGRFEREAAQAQALLARL